MPYVDYKTIGFVTQPNLHHKKISPSGKCDAQLGDIWLLTLV